MVSFNKIDTHNKVWTIVCRLFLHKREKIIQTKIKVNNVSSIKEKTIGERKKFIKYKDMERTYEN